MFVLNKIYMAGIAIVLSIVSVLTFGYIKKREGIKAVKTEQLEADQKKRETGTKDVFKEKRDVDGISDSDLVDRLRRRGDDWGSL